MYVAPSIDLKIKSLYDAWAFLDLINFHGGTRNFDECHFQFMLCLQAPQLHQDGLLVGELYDKWYEVTNGEFTTPPPGRLLKFPRGHYKSTLVIGWVLQRIYRNPNITLLYATNVRELSQGFIRELRSYFEDEQLQETVWNSRPHIQGPLIPVLDAASRRTQHTEAQDKKVVWSINQLQMNRSAKRKEPTVTSTSVMSTSTGNHYDIIICDDIVDKTNSQTEAKIKGVKRWAADIASVVTRTPKFHDVGVLPDGTAFTEVTVGERIVTGTHYHPNDYYVFLQQNRLNLKYALLDRNIYANNVDSTEGYMWKGFTAEMEEELRAELAEEPGVFEAQYLNFVNNPALQILSTSLVQYVPETALLEGLSSEGVVFTNPFTGSPESVRPLLVVDPAISLRAQADYTAIVVGGFTSAGNLIALEFSVGHYAPEKTIQEVARLAVKWKIRTGYCETVAFQVLLHQKIVQYLVQEKIKCGILPYTPNKLGSKLKRIEVQLSPLFSSGRIIFCNTIKTNNMVMNTFNFFGRGGRDDPPDALAVVAEKSRPPLHIASGGKRYLDQHRRKSRPKFNKLYGGIY